MKDISEWSSLEEILKTHSALGMADKFEPMSGWPLKLEPREYNFEEMAERVQAGVWKDQTPRPRLPNQKNWYFFDLYLSIEYAKTFLFFQKLSVLDQKILLKNVALQCMIATQAFYSFDNKADSTLFPDGRMALYTTKRPSRTRRELSAQSIEPLMRLRLDKREYVLLKAIILCQAASEGLSVEGRELIESERNSYAKALFEYCCSHRGVAGPIAFANTIAAIDAFIHVAKKQRDLHTYFKVFIRKIPKPVLDELLD